MDHATMISTDQRILAARTSLADRLAALEDRVTDTVAKATGTVDHATAEVRGTVNDAITGVRSLFETSTQNFNGALDLRQQVHDHPWRGVLLAIGAGLATRLITTQKTTDKVLNTETPASANPIAEIIGLVRRELVSIGEAAIVAASNRLKENIESLASLAAPVAPQREVLTNGFARTSSM